jgi:hypothetical protein
MLLSLAGICAAGVIFLLRFLVALCREPGPGHAAHLLRVTPARAADDEPDSREIREPLDLGNHRSIRRRSAKDSAAATTPAWGEVAIASSARQRARKRHAASKARCSS